MKTTSEPHKLSPKKYRLMVGPLLLKRCASSSKILKD